MLSKYMNQARVNNVQVFADLAASIETSFEGNRNYSEAQYFKFEHDGLVNVTLRLNIDSGVISIDVHGATRLQRSEPIEQATAELRLTCPWKYTRGEYSLVHCSIETLELTEDLLRDLVRLLESAGFAPRVTGHGRRF